MALPTVQPVDWPDWGALPTFSFEQHNTNVVAAPGQLLAEVDCGYFSHALIVVGQDGDGSHWNGSLQWWTAAASEGGSQVNSQPFVYRWPTATVIPVTCWAPFLRIYDEDASTYPHNALITVTLFSNWGTLAGWPGGTRAMFEGKLIAGMTGDAFHPIACGPGTHSIQIITDCPDWDCYLTTFYDWSTSYSVLLAGDAAPMPYNLEFLAPPSHWDLDVTNNDAADALFTIIVTRQPT